MRRETSTVSFSPVLQPISSVAGGLAFTERIRGGLLMIRAPSISPEAARGSPRSISTAASACWKDAPHPSPATSRSPQHSGYRREIPHERAVADDLADRLRFDSQETA